jgi:endonuclease/exonuclease/phosphatase family metal-dependent hydrolase
VSLRIMTFNIAHSSVPNLLRRWEARRSHVAEVIRSARADVVCLQEVSERQLLDLAGDLTELECVPGPPSGATRLPAALGFAAPLLRLVLRDFMYSGERCPIFLRRERFHSLETGSAEVLPLAGVPSTGTPHLLNWVRAADLRDGARLVVFNTHLGLLPWRAREAARRLLTVIAREAGGRLEVLTGDFNSTPRGATLRTLLSDPATGEGRYDDAWRAARERCGPGATFHAGLGLPGPRIDFVLVRPGTTVAKAEVISGRVGSKFPSDHCALVVELEAARRS